MRLNMRLEVSKITTNEIALLEILRRMNKKMERLNLELTTFKRHSVGSFTYVLPKDTTKKFHILDKMISDLEEKYDE